MQVGFGKIVWQQAKAGDYAVPAPALVLQVENLHLQRIAGLGAIHVDRAVERVDGVEAQRCHISAGGARRNLVG